MLQAAHVLSFVSLASSLPQLAHAVVLVWFAEEDIAMMDEKYEMRWRADGDRQLSSSRAISRRSITLSRD